MARMSCSALRRGKSPPRANLFVMPRRQPTPIRENQMSPRGKPEDEAVLRLVKKALGKRAEGLTSGELRALARDFVQAGTAAVRLEHTSSPREATRLMGEARERLARARVRTAEVSTPSKTRDILVPPVWRPAEQAMDAALDDLLGRKDVVACGLAYRRRAGVPTPERCVVVLVKEKIPPGKLARQKDGLIPAALPARGGWIPTDVVEAGNLELKGFPGGSMGPGGTLVRGTLGCFAEDREGPGSVALTSMHLLNGNPSEYPGEPPSTDVFRFAAPSERDPGTRPLGRLLRGTRRGVDAAKISVDSGQVTRSIPGIGVLCGWRLVNVETDADIPVAIRGAGSGGVKRGSITIPLARVKEFPTLGRCIITDIAAVHGDSGAVLVDSARLALGLLVGGGDILNVFSPMSAVLAAVKADLPPIC